MRIERVKGPHEWVGGVDGGIEPVQQQRQAVRLVAIEAVVTAKVR